MYHLVATTATIMTTRPTIFVVDMKNAPGPIARTEGVEGFSFAIQIAPAW